MNIKNNKIEDVQSYLEFVEFMIAKVEEFKTTYGKRTSFKSLFEFIGNINERAEYNRKYIQPINDIIALMDQAKVDQSVDLFSIYIDSIQNIKDYSSDTWTIDWYQNINMFAELFSKRDDALDENYKNINSIYKNNFEKFLHCLTSKDASEINKFIEFEFLFFHLDDSQLSNYAKKLEIFIEKNGYQKNIWLRLRLAQSYMYSNTDGMYQKALDLFNVLSSQAHDNTAILSRRYQSESQYIIDNLIKNQQFEEANKFLNDFYNQTDSNGNFTLYQKIYKSRFDFINIVLKSISSIDTNIKQITAAEKQKTLEEIATFKQHTASEIQTTLNNVENIKKHTEDKNKEILDDIAKFKQELSSEKTKIVEILAFFSSIIAFIFSTVSVGKMFSFQEALLFLAVLGLILICFVGVLSLILKKEIGKGIVIAGLVGLVGVPILVYCCSPRQVVTTNVSTSTKIKNGKIVLDSLSTKDSTVTTKTSGGN